ncbi:lactosylceramide 4-alpha-galactosyltransferase-like [Drosophila innubila]|uniref:lactosylceramide 4-alpha-galactosyltransferase-like n=1 Tax=Drosophila innubila TaxID=198719 RepID=UPI00148D9EB5|nr:lactosylceramide 4-alpha-galactosyltransferase-like [Drosophila innubila]
MCYLDGAVPSMVKSDKLYKDNEPIRLEAITLSDVKPSLGRTIFFYKTKCHPPDSKYILNLTARQACSIESAALHNPNFQVFLLFESPSYLPDDQETPLLDAIQSYQNVHLRQLNIWRYADHTPLKDWIKKADLLRPSFQSEYTSNLIRFLTLYYFGGIYLDVDSIVLRSLKDMPLNYMGVHDNVTMLFLVWNPKAAAMRLQNYFCSIFSKIMIKDYLNIMETV